VRYIALFPLRCPTTCESAYLGGIESYLDVAVLAVAVLENNDGLHCNLLIAQRVCHKQAWSVN